MNMNINWNDKAQVLEAVKSDGYALWRASEELKADKEVVMEAVKRDGHVITFASGELRKDEEILALCG